MDSAVRVCREVGGYITLENKGKIRPQPDRENAFARASGGSVRQDRTCLSLDSEAGLYAVQRLRHSARAAARFCLKICLLERLRS